MDDCVTVFHCGGRGGVHRSWENFPLPVSYVSFEPEDAAHAEMASLEGSAGNGITFINKNLALNDKAGPARLNIYSSADLSSFYEFDPLASHRYRYHNVSKVDEVTLECTTLDQSADELGQTPQFLCLDVQGAELAILRGGDRLVRHHLLGIRCEVEFLALYRDQPLFGSVATFLHENDFRLARLERPGPGTAGLSLDSGPFSLTMDDAAPAWADAIFLRDPDWVINLAPDDRAPAVLRYVLFAFANQVAPLGLDLLHRLLEEGAFPDLVSHLSSSSLYHLRQSALRRLDQLDQASWQTDRSLQKVYKEIRTDLRAALEAVDAG